MNATSLGSAEKQRLDDWLRRLSWALGRMPEGDRTSIVEETRGHIEERLGTGQALEDVIAGFGSPEKYARCFLEEMEIGRALGSQRTTDLLGVIFRTIHASFTSLIALVCIVFIALSEVVAVLLAVMEIRDPLHTGFWYGGGSFFIGVIDDPATAVDLLSGGKIYLFAGALMISGMLIARLVLLSSVRLLARRSRVS